MEENKKKMTDQNITNQETLHQETVNQETSDGGNRPAPRFSLEDMLRGVEQEASVPELDGKLLEQQINRRIAAIVRRVLLVLLVCIAGLLCILHPFMKLVTYNYKAKDKVVVDEVTGESALEQYLDTYTSVFMPYREVFEVEVKDRGFGVYTLNLQMADHLGNLIYGSHGNLVRFLTFNTWWWKRIDDNGLFLIMIGRFGGDGAQETGEIISQLEELPDSAVVFCSVTLEEAVLPEDLQRDGITIHWLGVDQRINKLSAGIRVYEQTNIDPEKKSRSEMTGAELKDEFVKELDILLSDSVLLEPLPVPTDARKEDAVVYGGGTVGYTMGVEMIRELRDYAATLETIKTKEICLSGKKADVIALIEEMNVRGVHVEDVWMSQWTK